MSASFLDAIARRTADAGCAGGASSAASGPVFVPNAHCKYIKRVSEDADSYEYAVSEHLRMSGVYWAASALDLVDALHMLDGAAVVQFVLDCQHECGGFGGNISHDPHILYTLSAVQILICLLYTSPSPRDS